MENKFTPGPWKQQNDFSGHLIEVENGLTICRVNDHNLDWEANAKLIAAAPELLEALQLICDSGCSLSDHITDKMLTAIKKATS